MSKLRYKIRKADYSVYFEMRGEIPVISEIYKAGKGSRKIEADQFFGGLGAASEEVRADILQRAKQTVEAAFAKCGRIAMQSEGGQAAFVADGTEIRVPVGGDGPVELLLSEGCGSDVAEVLGNFRECLEIADVSEFSVFLLDAHDAKTPLLRLCRDSKVTVFADEDKRRIIVGIEKP